MPNEPTQSATPSEPVKTEPVKTEPVKTEPVKTEPVKTEPVKTEPVKTEPAKTEPVKTEPVAVAPEQYADFTAPEGVTLDSEVTKVFAGVAKELNLPQDKAQLVIDKLAPVLKARTEAGVVQVKADLLEAAKADKEFGGDKLAESVATAKLAIDAYFAPDFAKFLNETGLGNHPEMIRGLLKIAQPLKQDTHVDGGAHTPDTQLATKLYNKSTMNA